MPEKKAQKPVAMKESKADSAATNAELIALAQEIASETGMSIVDAMIEAESRLSPREEIKTTFDLRVTLKPRVARWVHKEFGGHPDYSIEDRLAAYCAQSITRVRIQSIRAAEDAPEIPTGEAVTMRRAQFQKQTKGL